MSDFHQTGVITTLHRLGKPNLDQIEKELEVGVLAQVYRNCAVRRVCQVELADTYEHKHQDLSATDPTKGLTRMAVDITKSILRTWAEEGTVLSDGLLKTLPITYIRTARDMLSRCQNDLPMLRAVEVPILVQQFDGRYDPAVERRT